MTASKPAQQRPLGGQPALQHPADSGAHQAEAEPNAPEGVAQHDLSEGHDQALSRGEHGGVSRVPEHIKGLEVDPQRVGRVGEAPVSECVCGQQVTELIVKRRRGDGEDGQQGGAATPLVLAP